jgi:hypothetical protein
LLEWAPKSMGNISYLRFTTDGVLITLWEVSKTALGRSLLTLPLIGLIVLGLIRSNTRSITLMILLANAIFIIVPLIVSTMKPIITARYWLIGSPSLIVLMIFLMRAWLRDGFAKPGRPVFQVATGIALTLLFVSDGLGFSSARFFVASKKIWNGAALVSPLVKQCSGNSVHVDSHGFGMGVDAYAYIARAPKALFVDAAKTSTGPLRPDDTTCPILGWAEHVDMGGTDEELLGLLKIDASPAEVQIDRKINGYVVTKSGTVGIIRP